MAVKKTVPQWTYNNKEILSVEQFPEGAIGIIYRINNLSNGKYYFAEKLVFQGRKRNLQSLRKK